ncbi:PhaM family polyhydroxyalkanoate granule multifunctional regulatory protein [Cupriavidus sp. 2MCAB6]|uniref:PhaM family polyhydroxyalkanoate granule multifunctional regulatory protein n=1 Tax=Cupriavidus sp. 2MCAB6 TaxID=3232981 RepID=UPI003F8F285A
MFGQIPDFTNGFEFLRKMWGSAAGMPGGLMPGLQAMTPPMNLEEVDKRIHDLKAVEGWLQLNTNLLRTTIQGLEVQRATLVALQTIGTALSPEAMQSAMENVARAASSPSAAPFQHKAEPAAAKRVWPEPTVEENEDEEDNGPDVPEASAAGQAEQPAAASGQASAPPPDASLWWDVLQQQFNQIASSAATASLTPFGNLGGFGMPGADAQPGSAAKPASKPPAGAGKTAKPAKAASKPGTKSAAKPAVKAAGKAAAKRPAGKKPAATKSAPVNGTAGAPASGDKPDVPGEPH